MPKRKEDGPLRSVQVPFRLTPDEADKLNRAAQGAGLTREAYIRQKLFRGPPLAKDVSGALFRLTSEINRIGVNVNMIARTAARNGSAGEEQTQRVLDALRDVESRLQELRRQITSPEERGWGQ